MDQEMDMTNITAVNEENKSEEEGAKAVDCKSGRYPSIILPC